MLSWNYYAGNGAGTALRNAAKSGAIARDARRSTAIMIFSRDRILTTHVGSLPRNEKLSDLLMARGGQAYDPRRMAAEMDKAVRHVVGKQMEAGIDIGNDGEQRRVGFQTYVPQRMSGFAGVSKRRRGREFEEFPELLAYLMRRFPNVSQSQQGAPRGAGRHQVSRHSSRSPTRRALQAHRRRAAARSPSVHDRAVARHHLDHDAQRPLRHRTTPISTRSRAR